ncbi:hypothetical protein EJ110_NYTH29541 [Nymphaea thermarum]|nr:hypothetical protein EJ110_NYTH29541 [Nymphaea thermarum]
MFITKLEVLHQLALASKPIDDDDLVTSILGGLPIHECGAFQTALNTISEGVTLEDLLGMLLTHEAQLQDNENMSPPSTNVAFKYASGEYNDNNSHNTKYKGRPQDNQRSAGNKSSITCFACGNTSHTTQQCYTTCQLCQKQGHGAQQCKSFQKGQNNIADVFHTKAILQAHTSRWYPDLGATHHVTSNFNNLSRCSTYTWDD